MFQTASIERHRSRTGLRPGWNPVNVVLMIVGFAFFWPLGLAMLAWTVWGDEMKRLGRDLTGNLRGLSGSVVPSAPFRAASVFGNTGNAAFDAYRARELERIEAERAKVEGMRVEFERFLAEVRQAKDKEEFDRFLAAYNAKKDVDVSGAV